VWRHSALLQNKPRRLEPDTQLKEIQMNAQYSFLRTVTPKSTLKVLSDLLRASDAPLQRLEETRDGFVAAISVPGQPKSGAIYVYDKSVSSIFMLEVDNRDCDFSKREIDTMFPEVVRHLNTPVRAQSQSQKPIGARSQHHKRNKSRRKVGAGVAANGVVRPVLVAVAA
jgi:hypothetical protein